MSTSLITVSRVITFSFVLFLGVTASLVQAGGGGTSGGGKS
jgi:uncharacterized membrane protein